MDLTTLADAGATAYVSGVASHAATATDSAIRTYFLRLRSFLTSRAVSEEELQVIDEPALSSRILTLLEEDPSSVAALKEILGGISKQTNIEGAGTVYGDVNLRGKYVAGRDIRFDGR
ncbi:MULTISPECIES: hypothetical protein [Streptomyces]|uniref:Uncharacterized protein n=1 Tax=Streptomyces yatensis TaxID=155177 RepID=A0ABN2HGL3_9ACTN|nr:MULTISPECIES: hypothetical protein [Streptomyces]